MDLIHYLIIGLFIFIEPFVSNLRSFMFQVMSGNRRKRNASAKTGPGKKKADKKPSPEPKVSGSEKEEEPVMSETEEMASPPVVIPLLVEKAKTPEEVEVEVEDERELTMAEISELSAAEIEVLMNKIAAKEEKKKQDIALAREVAEKAENDAEVARLEQAKIVSSF